MNRILISLFLSAVMFPLYVIAEDIEPAPNMNYFLMKTKAMIDSREFLKNDGAEQMRAVSTNLSEESRMALYDQYRNNGAKGIFSFLVPSLGNWLVGDKVGGVISIVGFVGGYITARVGTSDRPAVPDNTVFITGFAVMMVAYFYSPISAFCYSGGYNHKLESGLGITAIDFAESGRKAMAEAMNLPKTSPELFHLNLLSYSF